MWDRDDETTAGRRRNWKGGRGRGPGALGRARGLEARERQEVTVARQPEAHRKDEAERQTGGEPQHERRHTGERGSKEDGTVTKQVLGG